jgi:hypothetical protein
MSGSRPIGQMIDRFISPFERGKRHCVDCNDTFLAKTTAKYCGDCRVERMDGAKRENSRRYRARKRKESQ